MNRLLVVACVTALSLAGCKRPADESGSAAPKPDTNTPSPAPLPAPLPPQVSDDDKPPAQDAAKPAPPTLRITTFDGKPYDLAEHRGKWVVVNFWATWCGPCLKEMPELSALDAMRENIEVIGLAYEDIEPVDMRAFLQKHPVVYPVAIVDVMAPPADFATPRGLPMTYLIDPAGKVAKQFLGPVTAKDVETQIATSGRS